MPRKLIVHIGPWKTGTSAVQHILSTRRNASLIYPQIGLWEDGSHHNLVFNFFQDFSNPKADRSRIDGMLSGIAAEAKQRDGNLLISSEMLVGRSIGPFLSALRERLQGDWQPEIIFTVREHFELNASLYNQVVKDPAHMERRSPDQFLPTSRFSYLWLFSTLHELNVPVTALNYHPAESFVSRFLGAVGFACPEPLAIEKRNVSLSIKGLIALLAANNVAQSIDDRNRYYAALQRISPFFAPSRFIFTSAAAAEAAGRFGEDRRFLSERFGIELPQVDWQRQDNSFFINRREHQEIADAVRAFGQAGEAIAAFAGRSVR